MPVNVGPAGFCARRLRAAASPSTSEPTALAVTTAPVPAGIAPPATISPVVMPALLRQRTGLAAHALAAATALPLCPVGARTAGGSRGFALTTSPAAPARLTPRARKPSPQASRGGQDRNSSHRNEEPGSEAGFRLLACYFRPCPRGASRVAPSMPPQWQIRKLLHSWINLYNASQTNEHRIGLAYWLCLTGVKLPCPIIAIMRHVRNPSVLRDNRSIDDDRYVWLIAKGPAF